MSDNFAAATAAVSQLVNQANLMGKEQPGGGGNLSKIKKLREGGAKKPKGGVDSQEG